MVTGRWLLSEQFHHAMAIGGGTSVFSMGPPPRKDADIILFALSWQMNSYAC